MDVKMDGQAQKQGVLAADEGPASILPRVLPVTARTQGDLTSTGVMMQERP